MEVQLVFVAKINVWEIGVLRDPPELDRLRVFLVFGFVFVLVGVGLGLVWGTLKGAG